MLCKYSTLDDLVAGNISAEAISKLGATQDEHVDGHC